uniref:coiled-coil domain-containing protein 146-like n=1 Tax=Myxine glutinosa TaxID=7769 RepID=UPI00358DDAB4
MDVENSHVLESYRLRAQLAATVHVSKKHMHERDAKAQECVKAKQRYHKMKDEVEIKSICLKNLKSNLVPLQRSVAECSMIYDIMKDERNVMKDLVQTASQHCTELREKTEILKNQFEVLEMSCSDNKRKINQAKKRKHKLLITHDGQHNKLFIMKMHLGDLRERRERQRLDLICLSTSSNRVESDLAQMHKVCTAAVTQRDNINQMLIQRDQEMSSLAERVTQQQDLVRRADIELLVLDEKLRLLTLSRAEKCRQLRRLRALCPAHWSGRSELADLQIELARCQDHRRMLEQRAEDPEAAGRARLLPGCDPTPQQLTKKAEQLELQLVDKESKVLQVCTLIQQLEKCVAETRGQVESTHNEMIVLGKKVNVLQSKISVQRRRMEALVSELAMRHGEALHLEQEVREKEEVLEQSTRRFNEGLEPWPGLEHLWLNKLRQHEESEIERALKEEQEISQASGGVASKAEARPTAYLPLVGRDGYVPHPYGAQAPFKPYPPSAAMRRFRKPKSRPLEI